MTIAKKQLVTGYLCVLAAIVLVKTVSTVYSGSMVVNHGKRMAELQQTKKMLVHQKAVYTQEIAQSTSLYRLTAEASGESFVNISQPLVVTGSTNVASAL